MNLLFGSSGMGLNRSQGKATNLFLQFANADVPVEQLGSFRLK
jgi:hypothetical protein